MRLTLHKITQSLFPTLTRREQQVCEGICRGLPTPEIAKNLRIAPATSRTHLRSIFLKTQVRTKAALVAKVLKYAMAHSHKR